MGLGIYFRSFPKASVPSRADAGPEVCGPPAFENAADPASFFGVAVPPGGRGGLHRRREGLSAESTVLCW